MPVSSSVKLTFLMGDYSVMNTLIKHAILSTALGFFVIIPVVSSTRPEPSMSSYSAQRTTKVVVPQEVHNDPIARLISYTPKQSNQNKSEIVITNKISKNDTDNKALDDPLDKTSTPTSIPVKEAMNSYVEKPLSGPADVSTDPADNTDDESVITDDESTQTETEESGSDTPSSENNE